MVHVLDYQIKFLDVEHIKAGNSPKNGSNLLNLLFQSPLQTNHNMTLPKQQNSRILIKTNTSPHKIHAKTPIPEPKKLILIYILLNMQRTDGLW